MTKSKSFLIAGAALGFISGSSMGIATGGTAYNAAFFFTPMGAFVGWLLAKKNPLTREPDADSSKESETKSEKQPIGFERLSDFTMTIIDAALTLLASMWNFHIDLISSVGLLPTFIKQPLLFLGLCVVISAFFPPFVLIYFCLWVTASHFGISKETEYRVLIK